MQIQAIRIPVLLLAVVAAGPTSLALGQIVVLPTAVKLTGPEGRQQLLVQRQADQELGAQLVDKVEYESSNPNVAVVTAGVVRPVGNGEATITAKHGEQTATTRVVVDKIEETHKWSFRDHVQAILAKQGCNSGACHGALAGKGGMKLSLRGYDTHRDFHTITRQARGRRVELADPGRSLIVAKPSGAIPHKGGLKFDNDTLEYRVLTEWIASGAPGPGESDSDLNRIEVLPEKTVLKAGQKQQILVRAHYADGRVEDVTRWAKFTSTNENVASIDDLGKVTVVGNGEGAVTAWFASKIVIARVTSPYPNEISAEVFRKAERRNFVDELVLKQLQRLQLPPSPKATDAEFLRRVYLDTIGTLPTAKETQLFLSDAATDKRERLIEALLSRPEFVDFWTYKWSDILLLNGQKLRPNALKAYYEWIHGHVKDNTPWDRFVREIVTAQGSTFDNGAANFYSLHQDPESMSENVSQAFLGLSIGCAKCHNHPLEKWTNNQYYAMANLFSRVRGKGWGGDSRSGDGKRTVYVVDKGELLQPLTGKPQQPAPLDGAALSFEDREDRRVHLANWLTSPENPYFARSIANRVWANFMGVGLVEPIDDMRVSNPATNDELLQSLADYLAENDFDLTALMRVILQSETYQRSSKPLPENATEERFYSRYYPRRLMAEVLLDAIAQVAAVPTDFTEIEFPGADREKTSFYPKGTRAIQLYDSAVASYFLKTFGRNERQITCECERTDEPTMVQVLHISNGDTINKKLATEGSRVDEFLNSGKPNYALIEAAYLHAMSRYPTDQEVLGLMQQMQGQPEDQRRLLVEDLLWSLMSSREFLFNH